MLRVLPFLTLTASLFALGCSTTIAPLPGDEDASPASGLDASPSLADAGAEPDGALPADLDAQVEPGPDASSVEEPDAQVEPGSDASAAVGLDASAVPADASGLLPDSGVEPGPLTIYGPGIGGDGLANTACGHLSVSGTKKQTMRFRAGQTSALTSARYYYVGPDKPGYGAGTGGAKRFTLQTDDGTAAHWPSGTILATEDVAAESTSSSHAVVTFSPAPSLTAGSLYHLVIENVDADPEANYFSPDYWYYAQPSLFLGRFDPKYATSDWAHGYFGGGAWVLREGFAPILDLEYANGEHEGMGYLELSYGAGEIGVVSGAASMVRETLTVSGDDRAVSGAGVRLYRVSGSEPLTVRLEDDAGSLIDSFAIEAQSVPVGTSLYGDEARWVYGLFSQPRTLSSGATYRLRLSTGTATTYQAWVLRRGVEQGYDPATYFRDGVAEKTTDGTSWSPLGRVPGENDLQFFFTTVEASSDCADLLGVSYTDYPVPSSIPHDGSADASAALNAWLASSVPDGADAFHRSRVVFPASSPNTYRMDVGLQFTDRSNLTFQGNGATLQAGPSSDGDDMLASQLVLGHEYGSYWHGTNTRISISGFHLVGNSPHPGVFAGGEFQANLELESSTFVEVCGCVGEGAWGDFAKIGGCDHVRLHHNRAPNVGRNGVSVISGSNIEVTANAFDVAGYCTFDVEPNQPDEACQNLRFHHNTGGTFGLVFFALDGSHTGAPIDHIFVDHNALSGSSLLSIVENGGTARNTDVRFVYNVSTAPAVDGPVFYFAHIDGLTVAHNTQPLSSGSLIEASDCTDAVLSPNP